VTAPAGYGKTTLLAQWGEADGRPFAWVSLDAGDNDPLTLLTYVALALNRVEPLGAPVFSALSKRAPDVDGTVLPRLGHALATRTQPCVLVLDDTHLLVSPQACAVLTTLLQHLPAGSQLVLAGRVEPDLPLGRLRAEAMLFELGAADLAFDTTAAEGLLQHAGVRLTTDEIGVLVERTEGWPAGLYLAALALRSEGSLAAVEAFVGSDRFVAEYFRNEVLERLSPADARFLRRTSILDRLSGPLCDAVLKTSRSALKLRKLEQSNLFLIPLDRRQAWYRYHTLFAEKLRNRLRAEEPELEPELHRRAAAWCAAHGEPEEAIRHALQADDIRLAGDIVWAHVNLYRSRGRCRTLQRWLSCFSEDQIASYPPLALAAAWVALGRDGDDVHRWGTAAANGSYDGPLSDGAASLESQVALLRAIVARHGIARMAEDAALARSMEAPDSPWQARARYAEGVAARLGADPEQARTHFEEGARIAAAHNMAEIRALCLAQLAVLAVDGESWDPAALLVVQAQSEAHDAEMLDHGAMAPVAAVSALVLAHQGRVKEARRELQHARSLLEGRAQVSPWFAVEGRLLLARACLLLAEPDAARALVTEARRLLRPPGGFGVLPGRLAELTAHCDSLPAGGVLGPAALTPAEVQLLHLLPTHLSFREIGERLHVSRNTVKSHAVSIYRKLEVRSRSEAVERAGRFGLIEAA
jgi:LuxR family maltose regulon positive regulatory protein